MKTALSDRMNSVIILGFFLSGFVLCHFAARFLEPALLFASHKQPVAFSHEMHGGDMEISCDTCHFFYEDGSWSGIPMLDVCADCHSELLGESEAEEKLVKEYIEKDEEINWALYFRQPQCVSFSHSSHVRRAKLACETCHGPQGLSGNKTEYLINRITKYTHVIYDDESSKSLGTIIKKKEKAVWGTMGMDECAACHWARGTSTACFICHK